MVTQLDSVCRMRLPGAPLASCKPSARVSETAVSVRVLVPGSGDRRASGTSGFRPTPPRQSTSPERAVSQGV